MKKIVMAPPAAFDVTYNINPWMSGNIGQVDKDLARQQWQQLYQALLAAGAQVQLLPDPSAKNPDAVFTANAGLAFRDIFISSRFRYDERAGEEEYFKQYFASIGMKVHDPQFHLERYQVSFEGAGDALFSADRTTLWYGIGWRSSFSYKSTLDSIFDDSSILVRPLELMAPHFYHLDTCFCPLDTGELLWYPPAFSEHSQYVISSMYGSSAIALGEKDARAFAANSVSVGSHIVMPMISEELRSLLTSRGLTVHEVDMSEFLKSGGAAKCLTLELVA